MKNAALPTHHAAYIVLTACGATPCNASCCLARLAAPLMSLVLSFRRCPTKTRHTPTSAYGCRQTVSIPSRAAILVQDTGPVWESFRELLLLPKAPKAKSSPKRGCFSNKRKASEAMFTLQAEKQVWSRFPSFCSSRRPPPSLFLFPLRADHCHPSPPLHAGHRCPSSPFSSGRRPVSPPLCPFAAPSSLP